MGLDHFFASEVEVGSRRQAPQTGFEVITADDLDIVAEAVARLLGRGSVCGFGVARVQVFLVRLRLIRRDVRDGRGRGGLFGRDRVS